MVVGENGNWFVDGVDTGKQAQGVKGDKGDKGDTGEVSQAELEAAQAEMEQKLVSGALIAFRSTTSTYADHSNNADKATNADFATNAGYASSAAYAVRGGTVDFATDAGYASSAGNAAKAAKADEATHAVSADSATSAQKADEALNAECVNDIGLALGGAELGVSYGTSCLFGKCTIELGKVAGYLDTDGYGYPAEIKSVKGVTLIDGMILWWAGDNGEREVDLAGRYYADKYEGKPTICVHTQQLANTTVHYCYDISAFSAETAKNATLVTGEDEFSASFTNGKGTLPKALEAGCLYAVSVTEDADSGSYSNSAVMWFNPKNNSGQKTSIDPGSKAIAYLYFGVNSFEVYSDDGIRQSSGTVRLKKIGG
jgi:hypothetical protein